MNNQEFVPCDDCHNPDGCLTVCGIKEFLKENLNVAEQRNETSKFWGDSE